MFVFNWGSNLQRETVFKLKIALLSSSSPSSLPPYLLPSLFPPPLPFVLSFLLHGILCSRNRDAVMNETKMVPAITELTASSRDRQKQANKHEYLWRGSGEMLAPGCEVTLMQDDQSRRSVNNAVLCHYKYVRGWISCYLSLPQYF